MEEEANSTHYWQEKNLGAGNDWEVKGPLCKNEDPRSVPWKKLSTLVHAYNHNAGEADRWIPKSSWTDSLA